MPFHDQNRFELALWQGTRLEALTDTVFGFAITLLVVSPDVSDNVPALNDLMEGFNLPIALIEVSIDKDSNRHPGHGTADASGLELGAGERGQPGIRHSLVPRLSG
ncbi:MAG: hypothetical protein WEE89_11450 [Gemmatimonadota bacterium]